MYSKSLHPNVMTLEFEWIPDLALENNHYQLVDILVHISNHKLRPKLKIFDASVVNGYNGTQIKHKYE